MAKSAGGEANARESSGFAGGMNLGSARVARAGFGVAPKQSFVLPRFVTKNRNLEKSAIARRNHQHTRRMRYSETRPITTHALIPPNPNELLITKFNSAGRPWFGTTSRSQAGSGFW